MLQFFELIIFNFARFGLGKNPLETYLLLRKGTLAISISANAANFPNFLGMLLNPL